MGGEGPCTQGIKVSWTHERHRAMRDGRRLEEDELGRPASMAESEAKGAVGGSGEGDADSAFMLIDRSNSRP